MLDTKGPKALADWVVAQTKVLLTDTTMRDGKQGLRVSLFYLLPLSLALSLLYLIIIHFPLSFSLYLSIYLSKSLSYFYSLSLLTLSLSFSLYLSFSPSLFFSISLSPCLYLTAHQSLLATRVRTLDLVEGAVLANEVLRDAFSFEAWGGATFGA